MSGAPKPNDNNFGSDNAATLQALGQAALAYASLATNNTNNNNGGGVSFPVAGFDASTLLANPAAAVAAVAAAAQQLAQVQGQPLPPQQQQQQQPPPTAHPVQVQAQAQAQIQALAAMFGHQQQSNQTPQNTLAAAATALLPNAMVAQGNGALNINHIQALLQSVGAGQHMNQGHTNLKVPLSSVGGVSASPTPPPPPPPPQSYSPPPPTFQQQRPICEARSSSSGAAVGQSQHSYTAAAQAVAAHAAAAASSSAANTMSSAAILPNIHNWSHEQLENHVKLLQQMKQTVPQSVALLLADARRKEDKRTAKRVANRKSACTSRARKKALVEEMTRTNARLRRQALILSLLPDLVIVISQEGEITFCSAQVERVLRHTVDDLVGADIRDILIPSSRTALGKLMAELTTPEKAVASERSGQRSRDDQQNSGTSSGENKPSGAEDENGDVSAGASAESAGLSSGVAAVVSDQSFPLSVVKVGSKQEPPSDENENSDTSGGGSKEPVVSSLSNSTPRSPSASLANSGSGSEDGNKASATAVRKENGEPKNERLSPSAAKGQRLSSSDDSSSGSTETKNIRKANENLERNVRWHNKKLQSMSKSAKAKSSHKDDVLGDSVTPNNALARLSSLQHYPEKAKPAKKRKSSQFDSIGDRSSSEDSLLAGIEEKKKNANSNENASDDSGYRESNDSREETSSSASESSNSNRRNKPLAPACNVCLIRDDLTTLWCEVTSSIRTREVEDDSSDEALPLSTVKNPAKVNASSKSSKASTGSADDAPIEEKPKTKELLLCLRPIRDGEGKVDESLRFNPRSSLRSADSSPAPRSSPVTGELTSVARAVSAISNGDPYSSGNNSDTAEDVDGTGTGEPRKCPPKKRPRPLQPKGTGASAKRARVKEGATSSNDAEKSVVESLMLMSNKSS